MLIDVSKDLYRKYFTRDPHPYITEAFIELVSNKADKVVRLIEESKKGSLGLIAGVKDNILSSPFSAPFGGFHFINDEVYFSEISDFVTCLKEFVADQKLKGLEIILPPDLYHSSINAKFINAFIQTGYTIHTPDIANWINLNLFNGTWVRRRIEESCRCAIKNNLTFSNVTDEKMMADAFEIIVNNRKELGREVHMNFFDLMEVNRIFPVDFFLVKDKDGENLGSAIFYRGHEKIVQAIFWGDAIPRKPLGTMDFLVMNLFNHYKNLGFDYIDLATSSLGGIPNEGLLRFKETHNCTSALRFTFSWTPPHK